MGPKPHVLGIDDGPFEKGQSAPVPLVAAMIECPQQLESVATSAFPVDGDDVADFLAGWITGLRCHPILQAVMLGGITLAGLAVVDVARLAARLDRPVLVVNRRDPAESRLEHALEAAGLEDRVALVHRAPQSVALRSGLHLAWAGTTRAIAESLVARSVTKARVPEPLRVAHLVARAIVSGESRGRV